MELSVLLGTEEWEENLYGNLCVRPISTNLRLTAVSLAPRLNCQSDWLDLMLQADAAALFGQSARRTVSSWCSKDAAKALPVQQRWAPRGPVPGFVVHRAVRAQTEYVQPVVAPRGDRRWAGEHSSEPLPVQQRRAPSTPVPGFVIHRAVRAQTEYVQPVVAPRGHPPAGRSQHWNRIRVVERRSNDGRMFAGLDHLLVVGRCPRS